MGARRQCLNYSATCAVGCANHSGTGFDRLLRDRTRAACQPAFLEVVIHGLAKRLQVEATVAVKASIFREDHGIAEMFRHDRQRHRLPAQARKVLVVRLACLVLDNEARLRHRAGRERVPVRPRDSQVKRVDHQQDHQQAQRPAEHEPRCVQRCAASGRLGFFWSCLAAIPGFCGAARRAYSNPRPESGAVPIIDRTRWTALADFAIVQGDSANPEPPRGTYRSARDRKHEPARGHFYLKDGVYAARGQDVRSGDGSRAALALLGYHCLP